MCAFVDGWSVVAFGEDQDGEFLQWIVLWCLRFRFPGDFVLELEGDAF